MTLLRSQCWDVSISLLALVLLHTGRAVYDLSSMHTTIEYLCSYFQQRSSIFLHVFLLHNLGLISRGSRKLRPWLCWCIPPLLCDFSRSRHWPVRRGQMSKPEGTLRTNLARFPLFRDWDLWSGRESNLSNILVADLGLELYFWLYSCVSVLSLSINCPFCSQYLKGQSLSGKTHLSVNAGDARWF